MSADPRRWRRVGDIFDIVAEAPADRRRTLLDELCADDAGLRAEVEALLRADAAAAGFEQGAVSARNSTAHDWNEHGETAAVAGARIGPWRVARELGRGGMGVVLLAERADGQYEQQAALKLIKRGMDSEAILARFLRERQILARLEHPHIARLLDGGIADDGRPYFAMEYVQGRPLLDWCRDHAARLDARIARFLEVCAAVQFAHSQLVVHRDIKPSNILVTPAGAAKLLDFGIAKAIGQGEAGTATALWRDRPLTPAYAAPEQLRGEPVTVATDVYGLGCVLYELLAGRRAFDIGDTPTLDELQKLLATTAPRAPSTVVAADAPVPAKALRGDLDTIALKALHRDPARRYATVEALAADLRRYVQGLPISARRDNTLYRTGKFVGRHRVGVAASAAAIALLLAGAVFAFWQAQQKAREAQAAQEVTNFLVGLFAGADPELTRGSKPSAQDLLDQGTEKLNAQTDIGPVVRARLLHTIAHTYSSLGLYDRAGPLVEQALALRRAQSGGDGLDTAESADELGMVHLSKGEYDKAEPLLREALQTRRARLAADDPAVIASLGNVAALLQDRGDFAGADPLYRQALDASARRFGADSSEHARRLDDYATNLDNLGRRPDAEAAYRRALAIREKRFGPDSAEVAVSLQNLGVHLDQDGDYEKSVALLERAQTNRARVYGAEHPLTAISMLALADACDGNRQAQRALDLARQALVIFRRSLPEEHQKISEALNMLASFQYERGDLAGAIASYRELVARFRKTLGENHPDTLTITNNFAAALLHDHQYDEAERLLRDVLARTGADNGQGIDTTAAENLATVLCMQGRGAEAVTWARKAVALQAARSGASANLAIALRSLAGAEEVAGEADAAESDFRTSVALGDYISATHGIDRFNWHLAWADFLVGRHRCAEAAPSLALSLAELAKSDEAKNLNKAEAVFLQSLCESEADAANAGAKKSVYAALARLGAIPRADIDADPATSRYLRTGSP